MERNYSKRNIATYLLSLFVIVLASSCTIYQNVPNDDGIYSSEKREPRVIVENSDEHREYEDNYFSKELERLDQINGTDILTDIDNYSSVDTVPDLQDNINRTPTNRAWGYNDNDDVVVNINLDSGFYPGWGWGFNNYPFWGGSWWWRNPWGWDYWGSYYNGIYCPPYWVWGSRPWGFRPYRNWVNNWRYSPYGFGGPRYYGRRGRGSFAAFGTSANRFISYEHYYWRRTSRGSALNVGPYNGIYNPNINNSFNRRANYSSRSNSTSTRRSSSVYRTRNTSTRSNTRTRATNSNTRSTNTRPRTRITRENGRSVNSRSRSNTRSRSNVNRSRSSSRNRSSVNRSSSSRSRSSANRSSRSSSSRASSRSSSSRSRGSSSRGSSRRRG